MQGKETIFKVAIAAYFHDIGKFAERAQIPDKQDPDKIYVGFHIIKNFISQYESKYLPFHNGKHTHKHALFTAAFIDHIEKLLPKEFNAENWGLEDSFIELAACHHKPDSALQWIIAIADRVSSAFEREKFENYNKEIDVKQFRNTRLVPLLENISFDEKVDKKLPEEYNYFYPLKELNPHNIFPQKKDAQHEADLSHEYNNLFFEFINALEKLEHRNNIPLWFDHFDSLFMIYASNIPAATVGYLPDTSLYDHSKTTSALATALYLYHEHTSFNIESIKDYEIPKFLIIQGDFYGIQKFIFSEVATTTYAAAKLLRGRSFQISLISELIAHMICEELNLTPASVIFNAAGQFTIIAPNIQSAKEKLIAIEKNINEWFFKNFYGESSFGIIFQEASCNDFINKEDDKRYDELWEKIKRKLAIKKFQKIDIEEYGGVISGYLDSFDNTLDKKLCPFCGKRPSSKECENDPLLGDVKSSCKICRDQIFIGKNLVRSYRIAVLDSNADIKGDKLMEPLLGKYQILFIKEDDKENKVNVFIKHEQLKKYWDISLPSESVPIAKDIAVKWINAYIPKYSEEDEEELRFYISDENDKDKNELRIAIQHRDPKTFNHIAFASLKRAKTNGHYTLEGIEALGILKADIDNLGKIFAKGFKNKNLSKSAFLSRQINTFFSFYIPFLLNTNKEFKNIYTVFAGGDDLFMIGPWNTIIKFAKYIADKFKNYVCNNENITMSIGIALCRPNEPVYVYAENSEAALKASKSVEGKNSITIFNETVSLKDEFAKLQNLKMKFQEWLDKNYINNAMLFRFNHFIKDAQKENDIINKKVKNIKLPDIDALRWRALFKYTITRNVAQDPKFKESDRKNAIEEVEVVGRWLSEYGAKLKIPLWQLIYEKRKI
jgi:CRISPR-associated protein Csm1